MALSLLLALALPALAAEPVKAPEASSAPASTVPVPASSAPAAAQASTAPAQAPFYPAPALSELTAKLQSFDTSLKSLKSRFSQSIKTVSGLTQSQTGTLYYKAPDRVRIEFESPKKQLAMSDKKTLWIYQEEDKQVIRADWNEWKKAQPQLSGLLDFGHYAALFDKYDAAIAPFDAGGSTPTFKVSLKPKGQGSYSMNLYVSPPDWFPKRTELVLEGLTVSSELQDPQMNPELDARLFEWKTPPGTPVINLTSPLTP